MVGVMSAPGGWVTFASDGLVDNKMIWSQTTPNAPTSPKSRSVMTRISDTEYEHVDEQAVGAGIRSGVEQALPEDELSSLILRSGHRWVRN